MRKLMRYARQSSTDDLRPSTDDLRPATDDLHPSTVDLQPDTVDLRPATDGLHSDTSMSIKTLRSLSYWKDLFNFGSVL